MIYMGTVQQLRESQSTCIKLRWEFRGTHDFSEHKLDMYLVFSFARVGKDNPIRRHALEVEHRAKFGFTCAIETAPEGGEQRKDRRIGVAFDGYTNPKNNIHSSK